MKMSKHLTAVLQKTAELWMCTEGQSETRVTPKKRVSGSGGAHGHCISGIAAQTVDAVNCWVSACKKTHKWVWPKVKCECAVEKHSSVGECERKGRKGAVRGEHIVWCPVCSHKEYCAKSGSICCDWVFGKTVRIGWKERDRANLGNDDFELLKWAAWIHKTWQQTNKQMFGWLHKNNWLTKLLTSHYAKDSSAAQDEQKVKQLQLKSRLQMYRVSSSADEQWGANEGLRETAVCRSTVQRLVCVPKPFFKTTEKQFSSGESTSSAELNCFLCWESVF